MIQSLFVLNATGEAIIEKHWRGNVRREDSDIFWSALLAAGRVAADVPPFLPAARGVLVHVHRADLFLVAAVGPDTPPLAATDFLARLADTLLDYFGELNEHAIKENFITVYELLDEMLDSGFPLTVEQNMLKQLVPPPTVLTKVIGSVTGDSTSGSARPPFPTASPMTPWRRNGVKHPQNEIFVDVCETVDAIFASSPGGGGGAFAPKIVHAVIRGNVLVNSRLSGMPDVTMTLQSSARIDDSALHHCVRSDAYHQNGTLSFVPPDGPFNLMSYVMRDTRAFKLPLELDTGIRFDADACTGTVSIALRPRFIIPPSPYAATRSAANLTASLPSVSGITSLAMSSGGVFSGTSDASHVTNTPAQPQDTASSTTGGMMLAQVMAAGGRLASTASGPAKDNSMEGVEITIPFGKAVSSASLSANVGSVEFDSASGTSRWIVGSVARGVTPSLSGTLTLVPGKAAECSQPSVLAKFKVPGLSASGMYVSSLELGPATSYKYFKGLRCVTKAERYELRT